MEFVLRTIFGVCPWIELLHEQRVDLQRRERVDEVRAEAGVDIFGNKFTVAFTVKGPVREVAQHLLAGCLSSGRKLGLMCVAL